MEIRNFIASTSIEDVHLPCETTVLYGPVTDGIFNGPTGDSHGDDIAVNAAMEVLPISDWIESGNQNQYLLNCTARILIINTKIIACSEDYPIGTFSMALVDIGTLSGLAQIGISSWILSLMEWGVSDWFKLIKDKIYPTDKYLEHLRRNARKACKNAAILRQLHYLELEISSTHNTDIIRRNHRDIRKLTNKLTK
jgi:hypothetical protein